MAKIKHYSCYMENRQLDPDEVLRQAGINNDMNFKNVVKLFKEWCKKNSESGYIARNYNDTLDKSYYIQW